MMDKGLLRILSTFLLLCSILLPVAAGADVTVFIYHRFGDNRYPSTNVDTERFREQMAYLKANDYKVIPLAEMVTALKDKKPLPHKAAVITIDDGYRTVYNEAWPVLRSFGFPFTVFLYTRATEEDWGDHLSWEQVLEMQAAGVDFQDHGYAHHRMADRPPGLDDAEYRAWIRWDLRKSGTILTGRLGAPPRYLALPYGEYNRTVLEEAAKLGYQAIFSQDPGSVSEGTDPLLIPREPILGRDWSTIGHFKKVLERVDLPFTSMDPALEPLADSRPQRFSVRLLHPERYQPGTLGFYVSELGWQQATLTGDVLTIDNQATLSRRTNRVAVSGREQATGRTAIRYWLLLKP
jgi:peptidoglycan/xylan/chitin deacetylase (PgdA/CDA1 family)